MKCKKHGVIYDDKIGCMRCIIEKKKIWRTHNIKMYDFTCAFCGKESESYRDYQVYCDMSCRRRMYENKKTKKLCVK